MDGKIEENKSYHIHFFVLAIVLSISCVWSVHNETVSRRPWKDYQEKFFSLESEKLKKDLEEAKQVLDSSKVKELEEKLAKLKAEQSERKKNLDYLSSVKELDKRETRFFEITQEQQFAKSLAEEAYYLYQHAFDMGENYKPKKAEWERLYAISKKWEPEVEKARKERDEIKQKFDSGRVEILSIENKLQSYKANIFKLENKFKLIDKKFAEINQIVIPDFDKNNFDEPVLKVDRCASCHSAIDRKGFEDFPEPFKTHVNYDVFIGKHPSEKFGCTTCHDGQGGGLTFYDAGHTPKNKEQGDEWEKKYSWHQISHWGKPMLAGDFIQSSCRRCHSLEEDIAGAPVLSEGINLFRERVGCINCHLVKGYEDVNKIGPELKNISTKVNPSWLFRWVKDPKGYHRKTRMPNFFLSDEEAEAVVSFLMNQKGDDSWKTVKLRDGILENKSLIAKGSELVRDLGCNGCHTVGETEVYERKKRDIAPILTNIAVKATPEWILNWILNPKNYLPKTLMPDLRLTQDQAEAIVAYLYSLKDSSVTEISGLSARIAGKERAESGLKVISDYGCYGCHDIAGTEKLGRVGAELSNFGNKELYELAFGYAKDVERSWSGYAAAKLRTPRIFETEIVVQKMPDFKLSDDEIHALAVLIKSFRDEKIPKEFTREVSANYIDIQKGRKLIKKYNCIGCHEVEKGWEGENILVSLRQKFSETEVKSYAPPLLVGEGTKVQSEWLFKFLHEPYAIRPWITVKMPVFNFTEEQVNSVVRYFQAVSKENVFYHYWKAKDYSPAERSEMKKLFDMLQCLKCHQFGKSGGAASAAELAPDLSIAKERLKAKWIEDWLTNPQSLQEGTKMPNFFFDIDEDGEKSELLPEPDKKIELLKNYLFSLK